MVEPSPYPSNRSFTRWWTARELERVRALLGDEHPDAIAAHAAAAEAWGPGRIAPLPIRTREIGKSDRREDGDRAFGSTGRRVSDGILRLMASVGARPVAEHGCTDPDDEHVDCEFPCGLVGCDPSVRRSGS